jgi:ribosome-associated heat shock protein Hsp15
MRIDVWLWAVRLFKTRAAAAAKLRAGRIRVGDVVAKPSTSVKPGDVIEWRDPMRDRRVIVEQLIPKRVGAPLAAVAMTDESPPLPTKEAWAQDLMAVGMRSRGTGRPTKKERRQLNQLRGFND